MPTRDDDPAADWEDDADTFVTNLGALPLLEPDEDDITTPRRTLCARCLRPAKVGGDTLPSWETMRENSADACWRSMGNVWWFCSGRKPWTLTLTG